MEIESNLKQDAKERPPIRMRCPNCRKLYVVDPGLIGGEEPEFECVDCHTSFGFRLEDIGLKKTEQGCPKCSEPRRGAALECAKCGIIFSKYEQKLEARNYGPMLDAPPELQKAWLRVIENYEDEKSHMQFVERCLQMQNLAFASQKYARILAVSPEEEIAKRMRARIKGLAEAPIQAASQKSSWVYSIPKLPRLKLNSLVILAGAMLMVFGYVFVDWRNLVGLGASMIALAVGFKFYLRT